MTYDLETIRAGLLLELQRDGKVSQDFGRTIIRACAHGLLEDAAIGRDAAAEITRLRARVAELEAAQQWQPIETAPNDAKWWLLWDGYDKAPIVTGLRYNDGQFWNEDADWPIKATHWMPPPAPPKGSAHDPR